VKTRIVADHVLPDSDSRLEDACVVTEADRILYVGNRKDAPSFDVEIDLGEAVLMPGLVNAHSHLDLTHLRGRTRPGDFAEWLERVIRARREPGMAEAALWGIREGLARGTTAFGDVVTPRSFPEIVTAFGETGARARLFVEAIGFRPEVADEVWETVWDLVEMQDLPGNVETGVSPHSPYAVSRPLLQRALAMADGHRRPLAIHFAETLEELAFLRHAIGPLRELLKKQDADDPAYEAFGSPQAFLQLLDMKSAPLLLVHGNYLRPREVPAGAFVVYCPTAHRFFGHPEHPVLELLEEGVRIALGSDSAASGETVDVLSETQYLAQARADLRPRAVFRMATEWGARALGLDAGRIAPGALADLAAFEPAGGYEVLGDRNARCVLTMVGGEILHRAEDAQGAEDAQAQD